MKNKNLLLGIGGAVILAIIIFLLASTVENQNSTNIVEQTDNEQLLPGPNNDGSYTMAEVSTHNDRSSCWSVIDGYVYDLTASIDTHEGGPDNILRLCGIDGSEAFNGKHGNSERIKAGMQDSKIGELVNE
jgi:cytochrome b involved in lipid metabolism